MHCVQRRRIMHAHLMRLQHTIAQQYVCMVYLYAIQHNVHTIPTKLQSVLHTSSIAQAQAHAFIKYRYVLITLYYTSIDIMRCTCEADWRQ